MVILTDEVSEELDKYTLGGGAPEGFASYLRDRMAPDRESRISRLAKAEAANQMYRTTYCKKVVSEAKQMVEWLTNDPEWLSFFTEPV